MPRQIEYIASNPECHPTQIWAASPREAALEWSEGIEQYDIDDVWYVTIQEAGEGDAKRFHFYCRQGEVC